MTGIPVLMYHAIEDADHPAGAKDPGEQLYVLQVSQFREQMEYLYKEGYKTHLLDEIQQLEVWPEKAVVLTFDDGHESNFTLALPILQEFGFKAHFFITTGWIGMLHFMNEEQIQGVHLAGMGVGSHGVTHRFLSDLTIEEVYSELLASSQTLQNITGGEIDTLSFPGGRVNSDVIYHAIKIGYSLMCSSEPKLYCDKSENILIPRIAITERTTITDFADLIQTGESFYNVFRYELLMLVKRFLGNRFYEFLRGTFLRFFTTVDC